LYQPAKKLFVVKQVQAGTCSLRDNSLASWYNLVPACRGFIPRQAGAVFKLLGEESVFAARVQACTSPRRSYSLASRCKPVPACQGITPWRAGTGLYHLAGGNDVAPFPPPPPSGKTACRHGFTGFFLSTPFIQISTWHETEVQVVTTCSR
jgi:hypothetical protein